MSKRKKADGRQNQHRIEGPFAWLPADMLESPAYRILSLSCRRILDRIQLELIRHRGNDNGALPVTYRDFQQFGVDAHAIRPCLDELIALGFIVIEREGRAGNAEFRQPHLFRLTWRWVGDQRPTDEWRAIETFEEARAISRAAKRAREPRIQTLKVVGRAV